MPISSIIFIFGGELLVLTAGFFALKAYLEKGERRNQPPAPAGEASAPPVGKPGPQADGNVASPAVEQRNEKSLSELYAEKNHFWVCPFCETLNRKDAASCAACGKRRS